MTTNENKHCHGRACLTIHSACPWMVYINNRLVPKLTTVNAFLVASKLSKLENYSGKSDNNNIKESSNWVDPLLSTFVFCSAFSTMKIYLLIYDWPKSGKHLNGNELENLYNFNIDNFSKITFVSLDPF